jgi:CBS domain-containing protein
MKNLNLDSTDTSETPLYNAKTVKTKIAPVLADQVMASLEDIMTAEVVAVQGSIPVAFAAQLMRDNDVGILPVVDDDGLVIGCVTDRDLAIRALTPNVGSPQTLLVKDVTSESPWCAASDDSVEDVLTTMGKHRVRRLPVVDKGRRLVGIVSIGDVAVRANKDDALQRALESISRHEPFGQDGLRS